MVRLIGFYISAFLLITACQSDPMADYQPLNLIQYGVPMTILAPDSSDVEKTKLSFQDDITIRKDKDFSLQLFVSEAFNSNVESVLSVQKAEVRANPFFVQFIQEDPNGFVYEMKIDSTITTYGFRYVELMGDKEYIFSEALMGTFTLEAAQNMYKAVQMNH